MKKIQPKARVYKLKSEKTPISMMLNATHSTSNPLLYFDEETQTNRALRFAKNQKSIFEDEQDDKALMEPIIFEDGFLQTKRTDVVLQQFLEVHPGNGHLYEEVDLEKDAEKDLEYLNIEIEALQAAAELDVNHLEMIGRVFMGAKVDSMKTTELKRDVLLFARDSPEEFLDLLDDENLQLESLVLKSFEQNILLYKKDKRDVHWNLPKNKKRILTVPFGEDKNRVLISFFQTDEGLELLELLEKKVK